MAASFYVEKFQSCVWTHATFTRTHTQTDRFERLKYLGNTSVLLFHLFTACAGVGGGAGGIPFEVWCRYYYPNVRDQVIAKVCSPTACIQWYDV